MNRGRQPIRPVTPSRGCPVSPAQANINIGLRPPSLKPLVHPTLVLILITHIAHNLLSLLLLVLLKSHRPPLLPNSSALHHASSHDACRAAECKRCSRRCRRCHQCSASLDPTIPRLAGRACTLRRHHHGHPRGSQNSSRGQP